MIQTESNPKLSTHLDEHHPALTNCTIVPSEATAKTFPQDPPKWGLRA